MRIEPSVLPNAGQYRTAVGEIYTPANLAEASDRDDLLRSGSNDHTGVRLVPLKDRPIEEIPFYLVSFGQSQIPFSQRRPGSSGC